MSTGTPQERVIEAALTLIADNGLSAVTMAEVARTAGVARATLYNHFPDVPSIVAVAARQHNEHAIAGVRQAVAVAGSAADTIEQLVRYVAAISSHGHSLETQQGFPPQLRQQLAAFDDELENQIKGALLGGVAQGDFRSDLNLATAATLIRHMLNGLSELVAATPANAPQLVGETNQTVLAAIMGPGPNGKS